MSVKALLLASMVLGPAASAGDGERAKALVAHGAKALAGGDTEGAITKFRAATVEDPDSVEAWCGLGQALERKEDRAGAVAAYRRGSDAWVSVRASGAEPSGEARDAYGRALPRLDALAPGEADLRRLRGRYAAELVGLARGNLTKDPAAARRAVDVALIAAPDDEEARELAETLENSDGDPGGADSAGWTWDDWIARRAIDSEAATYGERSMTYDVADKGEIAWAHPAVEPEGSFVLDMELRFAERHAASSHAGWVFYGIAKDRFLAAFVGGDELILHLGGTEREDLERVAVGPPKSKAGWTRLTVTVEGGKKLSVALDGKKLIRYELPADFDPGGRTGVWTQRSKVEYRRLRVGSAP
jgi:hypothetical protein